MFFSATGVTILASLAIFALGFSALSLSLWRGRGVSALAALIPLALVVGAVTTLLLGYTPPWPELAVAVPVAIGVLTAILSRSFGYGLLAGLIIAATMG